MLSDEKIPDDIPILILGNKIDKPNAVSEDDIKNAFHLHDKTTGKVECILYIVCMLNCCVMLG